MYSSLLARLESELPTLVGREPWGWQGAGVSALRGSPWIAESILISPLITSARRLMMSGSTCADMGDFGKALCDGWKLKPSATNVLSGSSSYSML